MISILFLLRKPRTVRALTLLGLGLLVASILTIEYGGPPIPVDAAEARSILTVTAETLATIFAISVSLILVSFQFVSEAYTPRVLNALFGDRVFIGYLITYTGAIFLLEGFLTFGIPLPSVIPALAYYLLIFCIAYLLLVLFHLPRTIHPVRVMRQLTRKVRKDFCQSLVERGRAAHFILERDDEPFLALEQIMLKYTVDNDFSSFLAGNHYLESLLTDFLSAIRKEIEGAKDTDVIREKPSPVLPYFLRIYRQLATEAISRGRELHLMYMCESLKRVMTSLHELKSFRAFEDVSELYEYAGLAGLEKRLLAFLNQYSYQGLRDLTEAEARILDEPILPFEGLGKYSSLTKEERKITTLNDILYDHFRKRLDFISDFAQKAAELELERQVSACMSILSDVLNKTLQLEPIERKRGVLRTCVMHSIVRAHKKCVDKRVNSTTFTTHMLHLLIERMKKEEADELGQYVTSAYAEMSRYAIQKGFYDEIYAWGPNGRFLVKDFPDLARYAIDVLAGALDALKNKTDPDSREYYAEARRELESLESWGNHRHEEISKRVRQELAKYPGAVSA